MEAKWVKKSRVFSKTFFILIFLFLIIATIATGFVFLFETSLKPANEAGKEKVFVITPQESTTEIANKLEQYGLIRNSQFFRLYLRITCTNFSLFNPLGILSRSENCLGNKIQAGSFKLSPKMSSEEIARSLTKGRLDSWITILEGWRNEEIATALTKNYPVKEADFLKIAKSGKMFPDTYLFNVNSTAAEIAAEMESNFQDKLSPEILNGFKQQGLTSEEGVVLASIVEREARDNGDERATIAGIFLKRLQQGWKLEADATIQYALGYSQEEKTWWRKNLTEEDLQVQSPFNTRLNSGLPPSPICNPGLSSLKAIAFPKETNYYYYLHDKNGKVHYAATLEEHNRNKNLYLQ